MIPRHCDADIVDSHVGPRVTHYIAHISNRYAIRPATFSPCRITHPKYCLTPQSTPDRKGKYRQSEKECTHTQYQHPLCLLLKRLAAKTKQVRFPHIATG